VLKWEGRMEELMLGAPPQKQESILMIFSGAHHGGLGSTGSTHHAVSVVKLEERRVELLGLMERFRDQGDCLCNLANSVLFQGKASEAFKYYQRARTIAEAHGFFSVECKSCQGLGRLAMREGRHDEAVQLFQNALAATPLCENDDGDAILQELKVLNMLTDALFMTGSVDEVEPLVERYRAAFKPVGREESLRAFELHTFKPGMRGQASLPAFELHSLYASARLHEARGRPKEAEGEVRALLSIIRANAEQVFDAHAACNVVVQQAFDHLKILDAHTGNKEFRRFVISEINGQPLWMAGVENQREVEEKQRTGTN